MKKNNSFSVVKPNFNMKKGEIIMGDIKLIIELFAIGFIIAVLFYASGLSIQNIFDFTGNLLIQLLTGFVGLIGQLITYIVGGIVNAISSALSFAINLI